MSALVVLAFAAAATIVAAETGAPYHGWRFNPDISSAETLTVALVRGKAERIERPGPPVVTVSPLSGDVAAVHFEMVKGAHGWIVRDIYPQSSIDGAYPSECLPPIGERGDFWHSDAAFRVVVAAPAETKIAFQVMDPRN